MHTARGRLTTRHRAARLLMDSTSARTDAEPDVVFLGWPPGGPGYRPRGGRGVQLLMDEYMGLPAVTSSLRTPKPRTQAERRRAAGPLHIPRTSHGWAQSWNTRMVRAISQLDLGLYALAGSLKSSPVLHQRRAVVMVRGRMDRCIPNILMLWHCKTGVMNRLATRVHRARHNQAGLAPTEPCTGCSRFLLNSGFEWGRCYPVAHSTELLAKDETRMPCRMLAACVAMDQVASLETPPHSDTPSGLLHAPRGTEQHAVEHGVGHNRRAHEFGGILLKILQILRF